MIDVNWDPPRRTLRLFGFVSCPAFAALGAWAWLAGGLFGLDFAPVAARWTAVGLWAAAACCGIVAAVAPRRLRCLYVFLTAVTLPIGLVVSHAALGVLYFGIMTPIALVFRLIGRDALQRKRDPDADSYWIARRPETNVERYFRQF